jgi:hypothetical protein
MAENKITRHPLPDLSIPEMRHEHADVNVWAIGKVAIALILVTIASVFLMFGVFRYFELRENAGQEPRNAGASVNAGKLPPEPNLIYNENEAGNLQQIRGGEELLLNGYSWVDRQHGVVRIPIGRAIDLLAGRGIPPRPQSETGVAPRAQQPSPEQEPSAQQDQAK